MERVLSTDTAVASGGVLTLTPTPSNPKSGVFVTTSAPWRLRDSSVSINLRQVVSSSSIDCQMVVMNPADRWNDQIGFWYERGVIYLFTMTDGVENDFGVLTYSSTADAYLRLRESAGRIYWETSADGSTWNVQASAADSAAPKVPLDGLLLSLFVKEYGSGTATPGAMKIAHLNGG